jgi:transmembrane sensor
VEGFLNKVEESRSAIAPPGWTHERALAAWEKLERRKRTWRWPRLVILAPALAAVAWLVLRPAETVAPEPRPAARARPVPTRDLVLRDGSRVESLGAGRARLVEDSPALAKLALEEGAARFEVVPNKRRRFRVEVGPDLAVEALGTIFTVGREPGAPPEGPSRVRVAVVVGRVRVEWPGGQAELEQGEDGLYPGEVVPEEALAPPVVPATHKASVKRPTWQTLARARKFDAAYAALARVGGAAAVRDQPAELLLAADVARRAGRPREAAEHLARITTDHARDPRASVAAFTLGRVHAGLGEGASSAAAFEKAEHLAPRGPLADEALARAASAWARAGRQADAARVASRYLARHPRGAHAGAMRRLAP